MKKLSHYIVVSFLIACVTLMSCGGSGKIGGKKGCGCGVHKGYVGY